MSRTMLLRRLEQSLLRLKLQGQERYAWLCGSFAPLIILLIVTPITAQSFESRDKYIILALLLGVVPLLSYFVVRKPAGLAALLRPVVTETLFSVNLVFILAGTAWFAWPRLQAKLGPFSLVAVSIAYLLGLAAILALAWIWRGRSLPPFIATVHTLGNSLLMLLVPVAVVVCTVLPANWFVNALYRPVAGGIAGGIAFILFLFWHLPALRHGKWLKQVAWAFSALAMLSPFLMIDPELSYDALHYTAYLAPATAVAAGRIPLVDVFSQYGQSYLIYNLGFLLLPSTYHAASLITAFSNALYMLCALLILRRLMRSDIAFVMIAAGLPFLFWMTFHHNVAMTPSHGGLRYLPIIMVATALVWMDGHRRFGSAAVAAICSAWWWSFEAALYSTFIYVLFLVGRAAMTKPSFPAVFADALYNLARLAGVFVAFGAILSLIYLAAFQSLPRFDLYLSLVLSYIGTDPFTEYAFYMPGFFAWVPVLAAYFTATCLVARQCFLNDAPKSDQTALLAIILGLGIAIGGYCIVSTQPFIMKVVLLPFYILLIWTVEKAIATRTLRVTSLSALSLMPVLVFIVAIMAGTAVGNFAGPPKYGMPNSTVLRHILTYKQLGPSDFSARLTRFCTPPGLDEPGNVCKVDPNLPVTYPGEFAALAERWQRDAESLFTFDPQDAMIHVRFGKPHALPVSFSYVDGFSPQLFQHIVERSRQVIPTLPEGTTVIATKDLMSLNELEWALIKELDKVWALQKIDETEHMAVYRLAKREAQSGQDSLMLPDRPLKLRNSI